LLDVHPPHEPVHGWKAALTHIGIIVIGLFIAVAIEQTVVHFHEAHERHSLEEQMRTVLADDLRLDDENLREFAQLRAYFAEQRLAILAHLHRGVPAAAPPANDPRMKIFFRFPSLAPYEAAKEKGTVALLPTERIRIYNRIAFALQLAARVRDGHLDTLQAITAFHERYTDSTGNLQLRSVAPGPDLGALSPAELDRYLDLIAAAIKYVDLFSARLRLFDAEALAILHGATEESQLLDAATQSLEPSTPSAP
jgi:hypothetical protein